MKVFNANETVLLRSLSYQEILKSVYEEQLWDERNNGMRRSFDSDLPMAIPSQICYFAVQICSIAIYARQPAFPLNLPASMSLEEIV